ncbi:MAG: hypothetical protein JXM71_07875, partial [Spirochaetales bacterium]|nr:hypothetical protein [Spirochaetales bacterium]
MNATIPLLHDNHNHAALYAALATCPNISQLDAANAVQLLHELPIDSLSVVTGWKSNELAITQQLRSSLPPVILVNFSLHGFIISDSGLPYVEATFP